MDWDQPSTWPSSTPDRSDGAATTATTAATAAAAATGPAAAAAAAAAAAGGEQQPSPRQYDVLLGADLLYTRSYARKVASVATQLLRPGGILVLATPRERAGYETLLSAVPPSWSCEESAVPSSWRGSPFRDVTDQVSKNCFVSHVYAAKTDHLTKTGSGLA